MYKTISLYVHIPFCVQKCNYCDFLSFPSEEEVQKAYVEGLIKEIKMYSRSGKYRLASLYFGGGTPSLLSEESFSNIFSALKDGFMFAEDAEITVEVNPGTLFANKANHLAKLGVNRISLGVQSIHDDELSVMGRIHKAEDVCTAVDFIKKAGITNYSFDLIAGLPNQNVQKLLYSIERAILLEPKHISLYGLKIEEGTKWEKIFKEGKLPLPSEDSTADMMADAIKLLAKRGYQRYEISNYSLKGFQSRHNMCYWLNNEYLGIGLGSSSFLKHERFSNERDLKKYLHIIKNDEFPIDDREKITADIEQAETMFLGLRLVEGVERATFKKRFGKEIVDIFGPQLKKHTSLGLLEVLATHVILTKRGLDLANEVMQDFISS